MKAYAIGLYEKAMPETLGWKEKLTCALRCGYDFVEMSVDETDLKLARLDWSEEKRKAMMYTMREVGVPIRSMCLSGHRKYPLGSADPHTCMHSMEIMEKAICLADDLGIRIIQLAGYDVYYEKSTQDTVLHFAENLVKATDMAASRGIYMGFETMETEFMNTTAKAMKYVAMVGSPYLGVYPDSGNLTNAANAYGTDVLDDLETGNGHILALHVKETVPGKFREIPFGTGHVDFPAVIDKVWSMGVRRYVTELWDVGKPEWEEDIRKANSMISALLDVRAAQD